VDDEALPPTMDAGAACRMLTMSVLGISAMRLSGRLGAGDDLDELARDVVNTLLAGLQAGVPLRAASLPCAAETPEPVENVSSSGVAS